MSEMIRQPRIVEAANQSVFQATLIYSSLGYSVLPLRGKKPALTSWEALQHRRADGIQISQWHKARLLSNVGIICGDVSGNLVVLDLDGDGAIAAFKHVFPALLDTFWVLTGSGHGRHYYYQVDNLPPTTRVMGVPYQGQNLEMRANGCYVVAPPSIHPDTERKYSVTTAAPVLHLPDLDQVKRWLYGFIAAKQPAPKPAPSKATGMRTMREAAPNYERAAHAALYYESRDVAAAPVGSRNDRLNTAAYNLGQLVGDGWLSEFEVENSLLAAAAKAEIPPGEAERTIRSGIANGKAEPRSKQWQKRKPS